MKIVPILVATALLVPAVSFSEPAVAQPETSAVPLAGPVLLWPKSPRPQWTLARTKENFDGYELNILLIRSRDFHIRSEFPKGYVPEPGNTAFSVAFEHGRDKTLKWGLCEFREGEFLPALTTAHLNSYVRGLLRQSDEARTVTLHRAPRDSDTNRTSSFLGEWPRDIVYDIEDKVAKTHLRVAEYFFEIDGKLMVFRFEAPPDRFAVRLKQVLYTLNLMNLQV